MLLICKRTVSGYIGMKKLIKATQLEDMKAYLHELAQR